MANEDRDEAVLLCDLAREPVEQLAREVDVIERHPRHAELQAEGLRELRLGDPSALEEHLTELLAGLARRAEHLPELLGGDDLALDEELSEEDASDVRRLGRAWCTGRGGGPARIADQDSMVAGRTPGRAKTGAKRRRYGSGRALPGRGPVRGGGNGARGPQPSAPVVLGARLYGVCGWRDLPFPPG